MREYGFGPERFAAECRDDAAVAHDEQPVGHAEHLRHFRGDQQHCHAAVGKVADHAIDFDFGGDVDAARRLIEDEKLDVLDQQPFRQHDFLLVAAGKLAHRLRRIGKPDRQFADLVADQLPAFRSVDDAARCVAGKARQPRIVDDAGVERQPVALAVLGQHGDVGVDCLRRRGEIGGGTVQPHRAAVGRRCTENRLGDLGAAAADQAEHADDLAGAHGEADIFEYVAERQPLDLQHRLAGLALALREDLRKRPADHGVDQAFLVEFGNWPRQHAAPILEHDDLVGDGMDFLEPVGDIEDGRAGGGKAAHLVEQPGGFGGGDHRGRLVEDQDFRFGDERLGNFDDLLARDAERADQRAGIDLGEAEIGKHARGDAVRLGPVDDEREPARRHAPEQHILRDAEMRQQRLFLVDRADAERHRIGRAGDRHRLAVEQDFAAVGTGCARQHLHQRRLARAVLAAQRQHPARRDLEGDVAHGRIAVVALGDAGDREMGHQATAPKTSCSSNVFSLLISCKVS